MHEINDLKQWTVDRLKEAVAANCNPYEVVIGMIVETLDIDPLDLPANEKLIEIQEHIDGLHEFNLWESERRRKENES